MTCYKLFWGNFNTKINYILTICGMSGVRMKNSKGKNNNCVKFRFDKDINKEKRL